MLTCDLSNCMSLNKNSPLMNHWSEQRQGQLWRNTYHLHWWIIGRSKDKVSYDAIHTIYTDESLVGAKTRSVMTQYIPSPLMNHWSEQRQGQLWRNTYQPKATNLVNNVGCWFLPDSGRRYDPVSVGDKGVMLLLQLIICINGIIYSVITILHTNVYKYYKPSS
jgi:hypothetical protein